jgi:Predicted restriction endonuclease
MKPLSFASQDILFAKNVKREGGIDWAFFEDKMDNEFQLTFSKDQIKGAKDLRPGQIVLLFQKVDRVPGVLARTYLTHLVTPLDFDLTINPNASHKFKWERRVMVVARAEPRTSIFTVPSDLSFRTPNRGKVVRILYLNELKTVEEIQTQIWKMFGPHMNPNVSDYLKDVPVSEKTLEESFSALEGKEQWVIRRHLSRERNNIIIGLAKARALKEGNGKILCACCDFDFNEVYGSHGYGFIECHHIVPIANGGERPTYLEDLAMVCSNCHRMLHRKIPKSGQYPSVESLRELVFQNNPSTINRS